MGPKPQFRLGGEAFIRAAFDQSPLAYRELDDALGLTAMAGEMLADGRFTRKAKSTIRKLHL
jgi:hypothetical protein